MLRYKGFNIGETTPPPDSDYPSAPPPPKDDGFPKVFNMTSNTFTKGGLASDTPPKKREETPPPPTAEEPKVESEPPKQRETKKQRREKLAKAAAKTEAMPESKPGPSGTEPAKRPEKDESERVETSKEDPLQSMEPEPVKLAQKEEPIERMESEPVKPAAPQSVPVEVIETGPVRMSQAIPVETIESEPVKPVEVVVTKPEPVSVVELEPVKVHRAETVVLSEPVTPVMIEEVKVVVVDHEEPLSSSVQPETQVTTDELTNSMSEAELNKRDIGKVAEKLVTKSKIKKIKTKKAVLRKSSIASETTLETENQTLDDDGKENRSEQQLNGDDVAPGSKARKRPLEDATADWTTEGQTHILLLKCCLTILLAFIIATLAYFIIH